MNTQPNPRNRLSTAYVVGAFVIPLIVLAIAVVVPLMIRDELPSSLPLHWGVDGPDRFGSVTDLVWPIGVIGAIVIGLMGLLGVKLGKETMTQRVLVITNNFLAALFAAITLGTSFAAKGMSDASQLDLSNWWIVSGIVGGIALGIVCATFLKAQPVVHAHELPSVNAPRAALSETEGGVWVAREVSAASLIIGIFAVALTTAGAIAAQFWGILVIPVLLAFLLGTMFVWDFRVDRTGFQAHSALKIFRRHVPFDQIEEANVVNTRALVEFGGWGWRTALDGSTGIILRSGESLELKLSSDRRFVVTTKDAHSAAGLINTMLERERAANQK